MSKVTFDYSKAACFIGDNEVESMKKLALDAKEVLVSKSGAGNDFLGFFKKQFICQIIFINHNTETLRFVGLCIQQLISPAAG